MSVKMCFGGYTEEAASCQDCAYKLPCKTKRINHESARAQNESAMDSQVGGSHYKDMPIQPIEFCQKNGMGACESLAIKYISRHKRKNGKEDIEKAIHCLQLLLDIEYPVA